MYYAKYKEIYLALVHYDKQKPTKKSHFVDKKGDLAFFVCLAFFVSAILMALLARVTESERLVDSAFVLVFFSQFSFVLNQLFFIFSTFKYLRQSVSNFLIPLSEVNAKDHEFAKSLINYEVSILKAVKEKIDYESEAMYSRIGSVVGAIDKTGVVIFAFTTTVAYLKLSDSPAIQSDSIEVVMFTVAALYLSAMYSMSFKRKLDRFSTLMGLAINLKEEEAEKK